MFKTLKLLLCAILCVHNAYSVSRTWSGGTGTNINTAANWDTIPNFTTDDWIFTGANTAVSVNAAVTTSGITFDASAGAFDIADGGGSITLNGDIVNNDADLQTISEAITLGADIAINTASGDILVSGVVSGAQKISKTGSGSLTLSGANTYSDTTSVSAGSLFINGSPSGNSAVTISDGATLGGIGTVDGTVTLSGSGSVLTGGNANAAGTLTLSNAGSPAITSGTFFIEIADVDGSTNGTTKGSDYDYINFSGGGLDFTGASANSIKLKIRNTTAGFFQSLNGLGSFTSSPGYGTATGDLEIISSTGGITDFQESYFQIDSDILNINWEIKQVGNSLWLSYAAVPESSTYAMCVGVLLLPAIAFYKRRKKRSESTPSDL